MATPPTNITEDEVFDEYVIEDENENQDEDEDENEGEGEDEENIEIIKNSVELPSSQYELDSILSSCQKTTNIRVVDDELTNLLKDWGHLEVLDHFKKEHIDIEVLKNIECHHLGEIMKPFSYGKLILFEAKLKEWRSALGKPLLLYQTSFRPLQNSQCSSEASFSVVSTPTTPKSSRSENSPNSIPLGEILNSNPKTLALAESYEKSKKFQEHQRKELINAIAIYFDQNNLHLDLHSSYKIEQEILERFPTEKLEYYRTSKRGKIYAKFCNIKSSSRTNVTNKSK
ncbi:uncharacterized protein LOC129913181 [Episyrphus balteatus]|uniref:uncharacterized protein LOC129913181 n=1 Tax=Episyrphus balteatus TaxID=286459 RepID=UPI002485A302|nr:uncharacterized protein LOC129907702 isoform X2 [Episyrphus balteatus]XP_055847707.1 uncharacterized protein LOC129913181 [Episyrphus balteatus]